jgi:hypothetical protein
MTDDVKEKLRQHIQNWKETGKFLENLRIEESRKANLDEVIMSLNDASESALEMFPPIPTSGLIEMQRIFMKQKR